ncbi:hypothetical protein CVT24_006024 [Panaeolus cyanescens]|uniref:Uncharacterized protein n=1 Tax=Panaeolus cyanescens TaxID=181874 RepID=A0A409YE29_9AGAR|nr:hypothetical protein CVT24_006024 [Panaeolus cyanescens]
MSNQTPDSSSALADLRILNIKQAVDDFLKDHGSDEQISSVTKALRHDEDFHRSIIDTIGTYVQEHPFETALYIISVVLILAGLVLICNPVSVARFGALGPVAGSLAAAWQSSMGGAVAAGSAFAILQSLGMVAPVIIPASGAALVATGAATVSATAVFGGQVKASAKDWGKPFDDAGQGMKDAGEISGNAFEQAGQQMGNCAQDAAQNISGWLN